MESATTQQLALTRLWYLIGEWEGTGKGPEMRLRASARYAWALNDHFITGQFSVSDSMSGQVVLAEHMYYCYDTAVGCLSCQLFSSDGATEYALGHADARGRMVLTTDRLGCVPPGKTPHRLRRTVWTMAAAQWAFTIERDGGQGFVPYLEGQMRRKL